MRTSGNDGIEEMDEACPSLVDRVRQEVVERLKAPAPDMEAAFNLVRHGAEQAMTVAGSTKSDLREWHMLATDLAATLRSLDGDLSERARLIAGRLRARVGLMARTRG